MPFSTLFLSVIVVILSVAKEPSRGTLFRYEGRSEREISQGDNERQEARRLPCSSMKT